MGVIVGIAEMFCRLKTHVDFTGELLTLGKQNVLVTPKQWETIVKKTGVNLQDIPLEIETHLRWKSEFITANYFFRALGFHAVSSIDVSAYESATYIYDLNRDRLPAELQNKFDFIFDGSTIEHIYHLPHVLKNLHELLKVGGKIFHMSPTNNFFNDGFFQFSPMFFVDYYTANHYHIDWVQLHFTNIKIAQEGPGKVLYTQDEFLPYNADEISRASETFTPYHPSQLCQTLCLVSKLATSTCNVTPLQTKYAEKDYWQLSFMQPTRQD